MYVDPRNHTLADLDPRYLEDVYASLSTLEKCKAMVAFLSTVVDMVRSQFCFQDPLNPLKLPKGVRAAAHRWWNPAWEIWKHYPHRHSLALNIAALEFASNAIKHGNNEFFYASRGETSMEGWWLWQSFAQPTTRMFPIRNQDFAQYLRERVYPSLAEMETLGPVLVQKLVLLAPFFHWVPPEEGEGGDESMLSTLGLKAEPAHLWLVQLIAAFIAAYDSFMEHYFVFCVFLVFLLFLLGIIIRIILEFEKQI